MELTTAQLAALVGRTERTVQRWIETGQLKAMPAGRGRYRITESDLQALLDQDPHHQEIAALQQDLADLRARVEELEQIVSTLRPGRRNSTQLSLAWPAPGATTPGTIPARTFAELHGLSREVITGMITRQEIAANLVPFRGKSQYQLTPEQQAQAVAWWTAAGIAFTPCDQCPHTSD